MSGFEIAGITLAVLSEALKIASVIKKIISDERHFGDDATKWRIRMDDEHLRLQTLQQLLFNDLPSELGSSKRMFDEFKPEWQLSILEMLRQLRQLLTKYIPMQILYELSRPINMLDPSLAVAPDLAGGIVEDSALEEKLQSATSIWLKWRWALGQKKEAQKLVAEFNEWNNT
jgi:Prion-inhibition and propagation